MNSKYIANIIEVLKKLQDRLEISIINGNKAIEEIKTYNEEQQNNIDNELQKIKEIINTFQNKTSELQQNIKDIDTNSLRKIIEAINVILESLRPEVDNKIANTIANYTTTLELNELLNNLQQILLNEIVKSNKELSTTIANNKKLNEEQHNDIETSLYININDLKTVLNDKEAKLIEDIQLTKTSLEMAKNDLEDKIKNIKLLKPKDGITPEIEISSVETIAFDKPASIDVIKEGNTYKLTVKIPRGKKGIDGKVGQGIPMGGNAGTFLKKVSGTNFDVEWGIELDPVYESEKHLYVPYIGATGDVDLGDYGMSTNHIQFSSTPQAVANAEGLLRWNATDGTLDLGMDGGDITQQIGQELFIKVVNKTASTILNGNAVCFNGRLGNRPKIELALADGTYKSKVMGLTTKDIAPNDEGFITTFGYVRQIKTDYAGWNEGDNLYVSPTTPGALVNVEPSVPHHSDKIGSVGILGGVGIGSIGVNISRHQDLTGLADVNGTPLTENGQMLIWNNNDSKFDFTSNIEDFKTNAGFVNRTDSTLSILTGTFTIAPTTTSYDIFVNGSGKITISEPQTVEITEDQTITYIFIDDTGTLQKSTDMWNIADGSNIPVSIVFKDGTNYTLTDERHSAERNRTWHRWAHYNIGTMYNSGLTGTFTNTTLSITQGIIYDEDIPFDTLTTKTSASLWYRNATNGMRVIRNSSTPYSATNGVLNYDNGSGTLQPVGNAKYINSWVYCSNDSVEPIYIVIGQNQYDTLNLARNATLPIINLSTAEWKLLYKVTFQNNNGTANYVETTDFRRVQTGIATTAVTPTSHSILTNRDLANSHPASAISIVDNGSYYTGTEVETALQEIGASLGDISSALDTINGEVI